MTFPQDLALCTASELIHLYRMRMASPVEAAKAALDRIDRYNGRFNAYSLVDSARALAAARKSEARWMRNEPLSDIDGITASIKDLFLARDWPTRRGSLTSSDEPSQEDSPAAAALRRNGAVLLGKTTTPEYGWKGVCDSPLTGTSRNPWNPERTPGGSSGGSAIAAALGMGNLHLGSDGGGSIRIPAAFTGIFGLKPTFGLVPSFPLSMFGTIAHLGPMTGCVDDAARMLTVLALPDDRDWFSQPYRSHDFRTTLSAGVRGLRIALSTTLGYATVDPRISGLITEAASVFTELGATVVKKDPGFEDPFELFSLFWASGAAKQRRNIPRDEWPLLDPAFNALAEEGEGISLASYMNAESRRSELGRHMAMFHRDFDLLLTPAVPIEAFEVDMIAPRGEDQSTWLKWTPFSFPFNLTQQPAASIPCGFTSGGMPVGLQIVGPKYHDEVVLRAARAYESIRPIRRAPVASGDNGQG